MVRPCPFKWPTTVEAIQELTASVVADTNACLDSVAAETDLVFDKIVRPLMISPNYKTNPSVCTAKFLQHCSTDPQLRAAADEAGKVFAALKAKNKGRGDVYAKVLAYSKTDDARELDQYRRHFLEAILEDFRRGGLGLDTEGRMKLQRLLDADAEACSKYKTNLSEDRTSLHFTAGQLEGLPETYLKDHETPPGSGNYLVTLKYPDVLPILESCDVAETRRDVATARETAYGNNLDLVAEGIGYRKEIASLLGYPSWAHFITETRMTGSPEVPLKFLADLRAQAKPDAKRDYDRLLELKRSHLIESGQPADKVVLEAWDTSYYNNQLLKREYGVDKVAIQQYFPLTHVLEETLKIYQEILGLTFVELNDFDRWHEDVRCFAVSDTEDPTFEMGHFYLDLHPRDGKYGHAAIFHLLKRSGEHAAVDCMLCNLSPPSSDGTPALLTHGEVETFFHEFGHIMHGLCAEGEGNSTRLAKCPRDFVEAPSQMLENWTWQPSVLQRLSRHHETGAPLPRELLESMISAKNVNTGFFMLRQIYLASLDLAIHGESPPSSAAELQELVDTMRPDITLIANPPGANMLRNFGHLMNQYSAAYHGYLWSEVLSADMYATRFEADCFDKEAGMDYRKKVLAPGGVGKIQDHLKNFLGRDPNQAAFLKSRGITQ